MLNRDLNLPSDEFVREQAYLVSCGVRPLALIGMIGISISQAYGHLWRLCDVGVTGSIMPIPFAFNNPKTKSICCGYAAYTWVIELLKWTLSTAPHKYEAQILGLLLGYSPKAITQFTNFERGAVLSQLPTNSKSTSKRHCDGMTGTAEISC